jgi:endonuclease/exonuclease/phosphatase family metal-dependent hydrolase
MIKPKEIEGSNTIIVGDFNSPLLSIDRLYRQKNHKEISELNYTRDQIDLTDIFIEFHSIRIRIFSLAQLTFSRIDHILGHKTTLSKFKKMKSHTVFS